MKTSSTLVSAYIAAILTMLPPCLMFMWVFIPLVIPFAFLAAIPLAFIIYIFSVGVDDLFWKAPAPSIFGAAFGGICCLLLFLINPPRSGDSYLRSMFEFSLAGLYLGGASMTWMSVFMPRNTK